jgi:hypothetical protein
LIKVKNRIKKHWKLLTGIAVSLFIFSIVLGDHKENKTESFTEKYINEDYRVIVDEFLKLDEEKKEEIDGRNMYGNKDNWIVNKTVRGHGVVVETGASQYENLVFTVYIGDNPFRNDEPIGVLKGEYFEDEYLVTVRLKEPVSTLNEGDNVNFEGWLSKIMDVYHYIDSSTITKK